jgi:hypothetical protein
MVFLSNTKERIGGMEERIANLMAENQRLRDK